MLFSQITELISAKTNLGYPATINLIMLHIVVNNI